MGGKKSSPLGDIYDYIRPSGHLDPRWQPDYLASVELPFSCRVGCFEKHKPDDLSQADGVETFVSVFGLVQVKGLQLKN